MSAVPERLLILQRELNKYKVGRSHTNSLFNSGPYFNSSSSSSSAYISAIRQDIKKRIKILNLAHSELMTISKELFYYNLVDNLGNVKVEELDLKQCVTLYKELGQARNKFMEDRDKKYTTQCERLWKRMLLVGYTCVKDSFLRRQEEHELHLFQEFFKISPDDYKEKIRRSYFTTRRRLISQMVKECRDNLEKNFQILLTGELVSYERTFSRIDIEKPGGNETEVASDTQGVMTPRTETRVTIDHLATKTETEVASDTQEVITPRTEIGVTIDHLATKTETGDTLMVIAPMKETCAISMATKTEVSDETLATKTEVSDDTLATKTEVSDETLATKTEVSDETLATKTKVSDETLATKTEVSDSLPGDKTLATARIEPASLENFLIEILKDVLTSKNKKAAKSICLRIGEETPEGGPTKADLIFRRVAKEVYKEDRKNGFEI